MQQQSHQARALRSETWQNLLWELATVMLPLLLLALFAIAAHGQEAPLAARVDSVGMTVSDMDRSLEFYTHVLPFKKVSDIETASEQYEHLEGVFGLRVRIVRLQLGGEFLELTEYLAPRGRPIPADSHSNDRWFQHVAIIVRDMDKAYALLREHKVQHASSGPQRLPDWNPNAGGIKAFYFKDPDAHNLEILEFPNGKGDPKWHRPGADLFEGIDHTAITVADTDKSLAFYRDVLGMKIAGTSENYGTEQEHLNNVFGARLRITALRAASGPGIELLDYLAPRDGKAYPSDLHANDVAFWQTHLATSSLPEAWKAVSAKAQLISSEISEKQDHSSAFLVRDPDGHAVEIEAAASGAPNKYAPNK
jgi:catechol 2,3-dioxygenase-like lactoylglutathione lyase family enzyme